MAARALSTLHKVPVHCRTEPLGGASTLSTKVGTSGELQRDITPGRKELQPPAVKELQSDVTPESRDRPDHSLLLY